MWQQTLAPAAVNFAGRTVTEVNPVAGGGGSGLDSCHFAGSAFAVFDRVTGGNWVVRAGNLWGVDYVGWFRNGVDYYRNRGRAPCGTSFQQQMVINVAAGTAPYGGNNTGNTNTLGGDINVRSVTSRRAGVINQSNQ